MASIPTEQKPEWPDGHRPGSSDAAWWAAPPPEVARVELGTGTGGLCQLEIGERLARVGPNVLPRPARRPWYLELAANFTHFFALLLWAGSALAWLAGMPQLAWAIAAVVVINGVFSYWQEYRAERAVEELAAMLPRQVTVKRDGQERLIPAAEVVPGDLLILMEGEAIPADARVVIAQRLIVDTSALTGESHPAPRSALGTDPIGRTAVMLPNLVLAGTTVVSGRGEAVVFATGAATEFGRIARLTGAQEERPSPLQRELGRVTQVVTLLSVAMGVTFFLIGTLAGKLSPVSGFLFAVGIIVANVPEGLLPTLTLALALGVRRMAARKALVKRLSAVEALGATTMILTDKTGTLTENKMTVCELWAGDVRYRASASGYDAADQEQPASSHAAVRELLRTAALCCDARLRPGHDGRKWDAVGDPTETAILTAAARIGLTGQQLAAWPRLAELPFDSVRKRMTTIQQIDGAMVACIKGAPSEVFPRCARARWDGMDVPFDAARRQAAQTAQDALASRGLRVLAVADRKIDEQTRDTDNLRAADVEHDLTFLGLLAMEDPPRPAVPDAIAACRRAGVRVVMVTGDDGLTAGAIGREIGLHSAQPRVVTGVQLETLDPQQIEALFDNPDLLFARVAPEHKLRLVEACQRRGEVVAVTGDGVNDAPALKRADVGVAMGETGTDVAREAADMVLADDNFASIVAAIEEGRAVYDNVRKFVTYIFASNVPEMVPFIAFALFRIPLPLTVMQVLAVDLGTDMLPALALGAEAPEPGVMSRPPRSRSERLLDRPTLLRAYAWLGMIEATLSLAAYFFAYWLAGWRPGDLLPEGGAAYRLATTMSLAGIVACQVGNAFACRTTLQPVLRLGFLSNRMLLGGIGAELALLLLLIYARPLSSAFGLAPLGLQHYLLLCTFGPLLLILEEGRKAVSRYSRH
jgi:Ca2+-transporting ATPase